MNDKRIIFQSTPFRSGSALLNRMLSAHPKIGALDDKVKFFCFSYNRYLPLTENNIGQLLQDTAYRLLHRFNIEIDTDECFKAIIKHEISQRAVYKTILLHIFKDHPNELILDKETLAWTKIPVFLEWFHDSKALLTIRDIRDVVVSFKKMTIAPQNDYLIALFDVIGAMEHFIKFQKMYPDRFYGVRYENLKLNPESETKKICKFLEIDYNQRMLDENNWSDYKGKKWANKKESAFYSSGDHLNPMGRWKRLITEEELFLCEWIGKKQMQEFGLKFENKKISQEVFNRAIEMITSSELLRECFKHWCESGGGVERYPLDPTDPNAWHKGSVHNPKAFINARR